MNEPYKDCVSVGDGFVRLDKQYGESDCVTGEVGTLYGFVTVYQQGRHTGEDSFLRLDFIWNKRVHYWTWNRAFSQRYIKTLAKRMALEIACQQPE